MGEAIWFCGGGESLGGYELQEEERWTSDTDAPAAVPLCCNFACMLYLRSAHEHA